MVPKEPRDFFRLLLPAAVASVNGCSAGWGLDRDSVEFKKQQRGDRTNPVVAPNGWS